MTERIRMPRFGKKPGGKKNFLKNEKGAATILMGFGLVPVFLLGWTGLEYAEYSSVTTRIQQAQAQAVVAIAKEGPDHAAEEGSSQGSAWMSANLEALGRTAASYSHSFDIGSRAVKATTAYSDDTLPHMFANAVLSDTSSKAIFYSQPLEIAMALDASASFKNLQSVVQAAVEGVTDQVFGASGKADDVWVSMAFAAAFVNIGNTYAQKLINPKSTVPYYEGVVDDAVNQAPRKSDIQKLLPIAKASTMAMLAAEYPNYVDNLLQPGAPGYDLGVVCVFRPKLNEFKGAKGNVDDYVEKIFEMPKDGFDMVQGINIPMMGQVPLRGQYLASMMPWVALSTSNNLNAQAVGYKDASLDQYAFLSHVPPKTYGLTQVQDKSANIAKAYSQAWTKWGTTSGMSTMMVTAERNTYPMVTAPGACPRSPMVIGAQEAEPLLDSVKHWGTGPASSPDEALAWSIRALEPNYADIWDIKGYPGEYEKDGGDHDKRIVFVTDNDMVKQGYASTNWGGTDIVTPMCEAAIKRGIKIYTIFTENPSAASKKVINTCSPNSDQQFLMGSISASKKQTFVDYMKNATKRSYRVKLSKS